MMTTPTTSSASTSTVASPSGLVIPHLVYSLLEIGIKRLGWSLTLREIQFRHSGGNSCCRRLRRVLVLLACVCGCWRWLRDCCGCCGWRLGGRSGLVHARARKWDGGNYTAALRSGWCSPWGSCGLRWVCGGRCKGSRDIRLRLVRRWGRLFHRRSWCWRGS